jgi:hypothetical protein
MVTVGRRALTVVAAILLAAGALAGVANREVLDGSRFASHADAVRMDGQVSQLVGVAITNQLITLDEDLVALRPAVQAVVVQLVRAPIFTPIVEEAVKQLHEAFSRSGSSQIVLRLADLSAVLVAALRAVAPSLINFLPADFDIQLADIGGQTFAARTVHLTRWLGLLAWLLPLLALLCLLATVLLASRRQRAIAIAGLTIAAAGVAVAVVYAVFSVGVGRVPVDTLRGALTAATWAQLGPDVWRAAAVLIASGVILFAAAGAYLPQWSVGAIEARAVGWLRDPGPRPRLQLLAGAVLVLVAALALYRPLATARVVVELLALAILAEGIARISRVSARARSQSDPAPGVRVRPRTWVASIIAALSAIAVLAYYVFSALPSDRKVAVAAAVQVTNPNACNGHVELCSRRYDQVAYVATHNSMSAADEPGWFIPEQPTGLVGQLSAGVRTLLIDTWYGQATERPGVIANAGTTSAAALAEANAEYGRDVVNSALRLRSALDLTPIGPVQPYLCHALCPLGSTLLLTALQGVQKWMLAHPREIITFIIEDNVSPQDTAKVFDEAGLTPFAFTHLAGDAWPTLGQMIDSGKRMEVFAQRQGGGPAIPWMLKAWDFIQDTPYDNANQGALSCDRLRGEPGNSLLLITNILTRFATRVSDSEKINAVNTLWPYVSRCERERGQLPNYVAVDYYNKGNVFAVVDRLNGVE